MSWVQSKQMYRQIVNVENTERKTNHKNLYLIWVVFIRSYKRSVWYFVTLVEIHLEIVIFITE